MEIYVDDTTLQQYIEHYAERLMERQINNYIQFKLKGVIEARLAALRLEDPSFPSLDNHITERLSELVTIKVKDILPALVRTEVKDNMRRIINTAG